MYILLLWCINALALLLLSYLLPSIHVVDFSSALFAALLLGFANALIRPVLILLTLPITIYTLGLFILIINAALFQFVGSIIPGFYVEGFLAAFVGAIIYSLISTLLMQLIMPILMPNNRNG